jgi:hypothetical protein
MSRTTFGWATAVAVLVIAFGAFGFRPQTVAQQPGSAATAKYCVIDTEGTNLTVVDNATNTLYYYTVEPGKEPGDELHLRGSIDLSQVGKVVMHAKKAK